MPTGCAPRAATSSAAAPITISATPHVADNTRLIFLKTGESQTSRGVDIFAYPAVNGLEAAVASTIRPSSTPTSGRPHS